MLIVGWRRRLNPVIRMMLLGVLLASPAYGADEAYCNTKWNEISNSSVAINEALEQWEDLGDECLETGVYEINLFKLYLSLNRFTDARRVAKEAIDKKLQDERLFPILYLDSIFFEYVYKGVAGEDEWRRLESKYLEHFNKGLAAPYIRASDINIKIKDYKRAKSIAEDGALLFARWSLYRNSMLANYNLKNYSQVPYDFKAAFKLNSDLIKNHNLMLALSRSYIELSEWRLARNTLINLKNVVPKVEFDQDYIDTVLMLRQRMNESGVVE